MKKKYAFSPNISKIKKLNIFEFCNNTNEIKYTKDPISKILDQIQNMNELLLLKKNFIPFLFLYMIIIHSKLYEKEEIINIDYENHIKNLIDIFDLSLLILDDPDIINYSYSFNLILKINEKKNEYKDKILKQIIISKIILDLIYNIKGLNNFDEIKYGKNLEIIVKENIGIINNNLNYLKNEFKLNLEIKNNITNKKIDEIYLEIIIGLIKKDKFTDYTFIKELSDQLKLDLFITNKLIFNELNNISIFDNDNIKENLKEYLINNEKDLSNPKIINFYYFILEYIFKNQYYIHNIPFLFKTKIYIIKMIKKSKLINSIYLNLENEQKNKLKFIFEKITGSEYYFDKYIKNINSISTNIETLSSAEKILTNSNFIIYTNEKGKEPYINYLKEYKNNFYCKEDIIISEKTSLNNNLKDNLIKLLEFFKNIEERLKNEFKKNFCVKIKLNFSLKNEETNNNNNINNNNNLNNILNVKCEYTLYFLNSNINKIYQDENIFFNNNFKGLNDLIYDINNKINNNINYKDSYNLLIKRYTLEIEFKLYNHRLSAEYIRQLENGKIISIGKDNNIFLIDIMSNQSTKPKKIDYFKKETINSFCEIHKNTEDETLISICTNEKLYLPFNINGNHNFYKNKKTFFIMEIEYNNYIFSFEDGIYNLKDNLDIGKINNMKKILEKQYNGVIRINKEIIAFASDDSIYNPGGELLFYNLKTKKKLINTIKNFSFLTNQNGLSLIEKNNRKILICACKKKENNEFKSGILIIKELTFTSDEANFKSDFIPLNDFEIRCVCPLLKSINKNFFSNNYIDYTSYFLVGGNNNQIMADFMLFMIDDNIEVKKINNFEIKFGSEFINKKSNAINCIIQCKQTGKLIFGCLDGNIYYAKILGIN